MSAFLCQVHRNSEPDTDSFLAFSSRMRPPLCLYLELLNPWTQQQDSALDHLEPARLVSKLAINVAFQYTNNEAGRNLRRIMDRRVGGAYLRDCGILYVSPSLPIPGTLADHAAEPVRNSQV